MTWRNQAWRLHLKHWAIHIAGWCFAGALCVAVYLLFLGIDIYFVQKLGLR